MKPQLGAKPIRSGIGSATSQPITSRRLRPTRSARPPAARLVIALAAPNASTKARMAVLERSPKSCLPTSGRTLRSRPTIPPTSAFSATRSENWAAFSRRPRRTGTVMPACWSRLGGWPQRSAPARAALGGVSLTSASANSLGIREREHLVVSALEADRGDRVSGQSPAAHRPGIVAGKHDHVVGQLEQPPQRRMQLPRLAEGVAGHVQVGTADIADQQRVAGEHQPRLLRPAPQIRHRVGMVRRSMAGRRDRRDSRIPQLNHGAIVKRGVLEIDARTDGEVRRRAGALHQLGQPRNVVGLDVGLEHRHDRLSRPPPPQRHSDRPDRHAGRPPPACRASCTQTGSSHTTWRRSGTGAAASGSPFHGQAGAAPLREADIQPPRPDAPRLQQPHGVIGIHAVGAAAVRDHLTPPRELRQS